MPMPDERAWIKFQNTLARLSKKIQAVYQQVDTLGTEAQKVSEFLLEWDQKYSFEMGEAGEAAYLEAEQAVYDLEEALQHLPSQLDGIVDQLESAQGL
jgi:hypothetical protein